MNQQGFCIQYVLDLLPRKIRGKMELQKLLTMGGELEQDCECGKGKLVPYWTPKGDFMSNDARMCSIHGSKTGQNGTWTGNIAARMDTGRTPVWLLV